MYIQYIHTHTYIHSTYSTYMCTVHIQYRYIHMTSSELSRVILRVAASAVCAVELRCKSNKTSSSLPTSYFYFLLSYVLLILIYANTSKLSVPPRGLPCSARSNADNCDSLANMGSASSSSSV